MQLFGLLMISDKCNNLRIRKSTYYSAENCSPYMTGGANAIGRQFLFNFNWILEVLKQLHT